MKVNPVGGFSKSINEEIYTLIKKQYDGVIFNNAEELNQTLLSTSQFIDFIKNDTVYFNNNKSEDLEKLMLQGQDKPADAGMGMMGGMI